MLDQLPRDDPERVEIRLERLLGDLEDKLVGLQAGGVDEVERHVDEAVAGQLMRGDVDADGKSPIGVPPGQLRQVAYRCPEDVVAELVDGAGLPSSIADALEAPRIRPARRARSPSGAIAPSSG